MNLTPQQKELAAKALLEHYYWMKQREDYGHSLPMEEIGLFQSELAKVGLSITTIEKVELLEKTSILRTTTRPSGDSTD